MEALDETATQALHRITSYDVYDASDPDADLGAARGRPRVVADLVVNDTERLPWFYKRYADDLPTVPLPRDLPTTTAPAVGVLAGTAGSRPVRSISRSSHGSSTSRRAWSAPPSGRTRPGCSGRRARRAAGSRWSSTWRCPTGTTSPRASTGTTPSGTRS